MQQNKACFAWWPGEKLCKLINHVIIKSAYNSLKEKQFNYHK